MTNSLQNRLILALEGASRLIARLDKGDACNANAVKGFEGFNFVDCLDSLLGELRRLDPLVVAGKTQPVRNKHWVVLTGDGKTHRIMATTRNNEGKSLETFDTIEDARLCKAVIKRKWSYLSCWVVELDWDLETKGVEP